MKKAVLFLSVFFCVAVAAMSQDTIEYIDIPQGYMVDNTWRDYKEEQGGFQPGGGPHNGGEYAKRFIVGDSVIIYGIAAGISDEMERLSSTYQYHFAYDTSYTNSIEYLRLYRGQTDSLVCLAQTPVHLRTTPIAYYMHSDCESTLESSRYLPMYERYFNAPVTVYDTFYAGMTFFIERGDHYKPDGTNWQYACPPLAFAHLQTFGAPYHYVIHDHYCDTNNITQCRWNHYNMPGYMGMGYLMLFPLLLPPDTSALGSDTTLVSSDTMIVSDTVIVGGDTVIVNDTVYIGDVNVGSDTVAMGDTLVVTDTLVIGGDTIIVTDTILSIMPPDLLQRLTGVTPNPARGTARVVASTGLTKVEVYSLAGRKVHTQRVPQGTLSVTLDVSRWPAGTYLLRIHTPMGTTIKKLTVAR